MLAFVTESCNYFILLSIVLGVHFYLKVHGDNKVSSRRLRTAYTIALNSICILGIGLWFVWFFTTKFV